MDEAAPEAAVEVEADEEEEEEEWGGIEDDQIPETKDEAIGVPMPTKNKQPKVNAAKKTSGSGIVVAEEEET
ncbi:hypothetical protein M7I_4947 [Glarea lozoyensis 74030]|uniref:Uncharacterized protein n=1 Tax=Glarea lozoyensis (strain ATCC 74030 / MF5533) TaxID=1104152 RepID=H0EQJ4_GLAL7|nr:hypothetical protein M7I_4947 [Glarea lozoyensis 74030]